MIGMSTSFGRSGIQDWWLQRISAVFLLLYAIIFAFQVSTIETLTFSSWSAIFSLVWFQVLTFIAVIAIAIHAWVGLWIVSTDYLKAAAMRNAFQAVVLVVCLGSILWAGMIFWG